jgi:hypothetical protein
MQYVTTLLGRYASGKFESVVADADGNAVLTLVMHYETTPGDKGYFELTNTKTDGSKIVVTHQYTTK